MVVLSDKGKAVLSAMRVESRYIMYTLNICPDTEILSIITYTMHDAKQYAKYYYPNACFVDITGNSCAVYEKFELDYKAMNHVVNIWFD